MRWIVWGLVLLLLVIHQDYWNWNDDHLVLGFLPITLFYHACISVAASVVWFLAVKFAWPSGLEEETLAATHQTGSNKAGGGR